MSASGVAKTRDFGVAIGAVIYETLILAVAMQVRRSRATRGKVPNLDWTEAQIAIDVILLKVRLLEDFLTSRKAQPTDMVASQFGLSYIPPSDLKLSKEVRKAINVRTAHLSWERVSDDHLPAFSDVGEGIDSYAGRTLKEAFSFISLAMEKGIEPTRDLRKKYWSALEDIYPQLV